MRPLCTIAILTGLLALTAIGVQAAPPVFSLAGNFDTTSDVATNEWSYGVFNGLTNVGSYNVPTGTHYSAGSLDSWNLTSGTDPNIEKNVTSSNVYGSAIDWRPGTVSFGPYQGPAVAQFIAPTTELYNISATFQTDQIRGSETSDGTNGYVYVGGIQVYEQELSDPGAAQFGTAVTYTANDILLTAGEKIDFAVGGGAFTTEVDATLSELPEPSAWAMMALTGLLLASGLRRKMTLARI
jgi:hypothetical protein